MTAILVVGERSYTLEADVEAVQASILEAVRRGGDWVAVTTATGRRTDILITASTQARVEFPGPDGQDNAGAVGAAAFAPDDFDDYGL